MTEKGLKHTIKNLGKLTKMVRKEYEKDKNLGKLRDESDGNVREHLLKMGEFKKDSSTGDTLKGTSKWQQERLKSMERLLEKIVPEVRYTNLRKCVLKELKKALNLTKEHINKYYVDQHESLQRTQTDLMKMFDKVSRLKAEKGVDQEEILLLNTQLKSARAEIEQFDYDKMVAKALTDVNNARKEERQAIAKKLEAWLETAYCMEGNKRMFKEHFAEWLEASK